jgi:multiple sugar transport system substrate-binding protein
MKRSILTLLILLSVGALLAACQPAATQPPATEPPAAVPPVEPTQAPSEPIEQPAAPEPASISIWVMPNGADPQAAIDAEIAAFNEVYPHITVTATIVGWGDAYNAIQTAVQGGEGPCITQLGTTWVPTFGTMGGLHTFNPAELEELGGEAAFVPASFATAKIYDNLVAVPWFADVRAIYYRTDIFQQAGVDPQQAFATLDSFVAALQKIDEADLGIAPFVHPGRNDWNVWQNATQWGWAYGGDILTADGTQAAFNSPEFVAGVTAFDQLFGKGLTADNTLELNSAQTDAEFGQGRAASFMSGPWMISNFRNLEGSGYSQQVADNVGIAAFPAGPGGSYTFFGGSNLGIMTSCPEYDAAWMFVKYLLSKESQIRYGNAIGMLPTTVEAQSDPAFTEDPLFSVFIAAAPTGKSSPNVPRWGAVENTLNTALQGLWEDVAASGSTPIDPALVQQRLDEAAATVNSILRN